MNWMMISILASSMGIIYEASNFLYASVNNNNDKKIKALKWIMLYMAMIIINFIVAKL